MTPDRVHYLDLTLIGFEKALRWGNIDGVVGFLSADKPIDVALLKRYEQVNIGGYNTLSKTLNSDGDVATVVVAIDYVVRDSMRVYKVVDRQQWKYDDDRDRWYLITPLPTLK